MCEATVLGNQSQSAKTSAPSKVMLSLCRVNNASWNRLQPTNHDIDARISWHLIGWACCLLISAQWWMRVDVFISRCPSQTVITYWLFVYSAPHTSVAAADLTTADSLTSSTPLPQNIIIYTGRKGEISMWSNWTNLHQSGIFTLNLIIQT